MCGIGEDMSTCMFTALKKNKMEAFTALVKKGAELNLVCKGRAYEQDGYRSWNKTCLRLAVDENNIAAVNILIAHGANLDIMCGSEDNKQVCLLQALQPPMDGRQCCPPPKWAIVHALIEGKADVNGVDHTFGRSALHLAAIRPAWIHLATVLLDAGATVDLQDKLGLTPLHMASDRGNIGAAALLLERKADVSATTHAGCTPLDYAMERRRFALAHLLSQAGICGLALCGGAWLHI